MLDKKTVHIISHSHWDREWYLPFEKFRIRLVALLDQVLALLASDESEFHYFHLDGHVLLVDDYLEIRPEREQQIRQFIRAGRLFVGPWYVLQDALLTSAEAHVRNLQLGIERARELGAATMVGYFPDTFGNISQSAQILQGFEIDSAVFGRGINAIAENNQVLTDQQAGGHNSELWWESPDGSRIFAIFLANWYHNGMELPTDPEQARERAKTMLANVERFATTPHLLLMNGCDHQPVQADIGKAIQVLNEVMPEYTFTHSHFPKYLACVREHPRAWQTVLGELTSEYTNGWTTLVNTASSRLYLKQWNTRVQSELEHWVEPFTAIAWQLGEPYPQAFVHYAWRLLLQNHPHDSICGCSIDEVHEEMVTRFQKAWQVAETLSSNALVAIAARIDTAAVIASAHQDTVSNRDTSAEQVTSGRENASAPKHLPLVVFNPLGWERDDWVEAQIDVETELPLHQYRLHDVEGREVPYAWDDHGWVHGFTLPDDRFRLPWRKRRYGLRFRAEQVPAIGHIVFCLQHQGETQARDHSHATVLDQDKHQLSSTVDNLDQASCIVLGDRARLENIFLRIEVHPDGSLEVIDKGTGKTYRDLLVFEDTGDIGNEYLYIGAEEAAPITTHGKQASLEAVSSGLVATLRIIHDLELPVARDGRMRSKQVGRLQLQTVLSLGAGARRIEAIVLLDNQIKDHRLRVLFPSDLQSDYVYADMPFDVVQRKIEPWSGWTNPSRCERMQSFFDVSNGEHGLMITATGLPEYEVLRDGRNTMALTLLRCVGELGDWNYFPTPGAQCQGPFEARFAIIPHAQDYQAALQEASAFNMPLRAIATGIHKGDIAPRISWASIASPSVLVTALKKAETFDGLLLRFVNLAKTDETVQVAGELLRTARGITQTLMNEKIIDSVSREAEHVQITLPGKRIMTLGLLQHEA